jgi:hypothetical protein
MNGFFHGFDAPSAGNGPNIGTSALGINDVQQVVGVYQDSLSHLHGFLLSGGDFATFEKAIFTTLDDPLATEGTLALGINARGEIVGLYGDASGVSSRSPTIR